MTADVFLGCRCDGGDGKRMESLASEIGTIYYTMAAVHGHVNQRSNL
jgi:hypothetical protein